MRRRSVVTAAGIAGAAALAGPVLGAAPPAASTAAGGAAARPRPRRLEIRGMDISSLPRNEDLGAVYRRPDGRRADAVRLLADAGVTHARLKVWVNPADGYNNKEHILPLARR